MEMNKITRPWCVGAGLAPVLGGAVNQPKRTGARPVPTHQGRRNLSMGITGAYEDFIDKRGRTRYIIDQAEP
jgi:hypothetical protein